MLYFRLLAETVNEDKDVKGGNIYNIYQNLYPNVCSMKDLLNVKRIQKWTNGQKTQADSSEQQKYSWQRNI